MMFEPMFGSRLFATEKDYPKQWSEIFKQYKEKQKEDEEMIKLTREELITAIRNQVSVMAKEITNEDNGIYWCHDAIEKMNNKMAVVKRLYTYDPSTDFELVPIEYSEDDLNPESLETCEVEIPDGIPMECMEHPCLEADRDYLVKELEDARVSIKGNNIKIQRLEKIIGYRDQTIVTLNERLNECIRGESKEIERLKKEINRLKGA